jgi:hypothetical protein
MSNAITLHSLLINEYQHQPTNQVRVLLHRNIYYSQFLTQELNYMDNELG